MAECFYIFASINFVLILSVFAGAELSESSSATSLASSSSSSYSESENDCSNKVHEFNDVPSTLEDPNKYDVIIEVKLGPYESDFDSNFYFFENLYPICGKNEVYDKCPAPCPPRRCDVDERLIKCAAPPKPGDPDCKPGCRCADNFYRDDKKVCVPKNKCPVKCKKNEIYDICPAKCPPQECGVDPALILCLPNPKPGDPECEPGCRCIDNHYKNAFGDCVPKKSCPKCGDNEVYDVCPAPCPPRRCDVDERVIRCAAPPEPGDPDCKPGCRCADNYYKNDKNICVTKSQCPPKPNVTCGLDEVYSSCVNGGCSKRNCSETAIKCVKLKEGACREGCLCKENYLRLDNGTCVPADQCPPKCEINEVYDVCPAPCPPRRCDVDERVIRCAAPPQPGDPECKPGCRCADNYYKNDKNICVTKSQCPVKCKDNEVYDICPAKCPPKECGVDPAVILCLPNPQPGDPDCEPGCRCLDDFYKNDFGDCIPKDLCPNVTTSTDTTT